MQESDHSRAAAASGRWASRSTSVNSSLAAALTANVATGNTLIVSVMTGTFNGAAGCQDSAGNTYSVIADKNTGNGRLFMCAGAVNHPLSAGDMVTSTYPGFSGLSIMSVNAIGGLDTPGQIEGTSVTASGSNPTVNSGAVTPSNLPAVIVGTVSHTSTSTFTPNASLIVLGEFSAGSGSGRKTVTPVYQVVTSGGSYSITGSLSGSGFWQAAAADFLATQSGSSGGGGNGGGA